MAPSIGADDSKYGAGTLVANYSTPISIFISPTTYVNYVAPGTPSYKFWYLDGVLISTAHDLTYTFTATGTYDLKLKVVGCFAIDSIYKQLLFTI